MIYIEIQTQLDTDKYRNTDTLSCPHRSMDAYRYIDVSMSVSTSTYLERERDREELADVIVCWLDKAQIHRTGHQEGRRELSGIVKSCCPPTGWLRLGEASVLL